MSKKDELKPCPFCGDVYDVYVYELNDPTTWWYSAVRGSHCFVVQCAACGASVKGETNEEAIRHWNQRIVPEGQQEGEWILAEDKEYNEVLDYYFRCSNCNAPDEHGKNAHVPFCWNCGAKMREPEKTD